MIKPAGEERKVEFCVDCVHWQGWQAKCGLAYKTRPYSRACKQALPKEAKMDTFRCDFLKYTK